MNKKVISQTANGCVFICPSCDKVHVEFNNFLFSFDQREYNHFSNCFLRMDGDYYEQANAAINYSRKSIVPIGHRNASMMLNNKELGELKQLLSGTDKLDRIDRYLTTHDINVLLGIN